MLINGGRIKARARVLVHIFACAYNNSARAVFRLFFCVSLCFCVLKSFARIKNIVRGVAVAVFRGKKSAKPHTST